MVPLDLEREREREREKRICFVTKHPRCLGIFLSSEFVYVRIKNFTETILNRAIS